MVALPSQNYAMPVNAFVEFFARALLAIRRAW